MPKGRWWLLAAIIIIGLTIAADAYIKKELFRPEVKQVQKFRFGIQCKDGSRVEYISPFRLPDHIVCQPNPGEDK